MKLSLCLPLLILNIVFSPPGQAVELLSCVHVVSDDMEHPFVDQKAHVDLAIDGDAVLSRVKVPVASKLITFPTCKKTAEDGSDFNRWFGLACQDMKSLDGSSLTVDLFFDGAYAAISRILTPDDSMWDILQDVSRKAGLPMPQRTFVIYTGDMPAYEFFCTSNPGLKSPPVNPDNFDKALEEMLSGNKPAPKSPPRKEQPASGDVGKFTI